MRDYTNSSMETLIDEWIHSDRDRMILKHRLIDGWTYRQIAEAVQMEESTCKRKVYKLQENLFSKIPLDKT